jgi:hypothetical protein
LPGIFAQLLTSLADHEQSGVVVVVTGNYSRERANTRDVFWWTGQARRL